MNSDAAEVGQVAEARVGQMRHTGWVKMKRRHAFVTV